MNGQAGSGLLKGVSTCKLLNCFIVIVRIAGSW